MRKIKFILSAIVMLAVSFSANAADYVLSYDKTEGCLTLTWPEDADIKTVNNSGCYIEGYDGQLNLQLANSTGDFLASNRNQIVAYVNLTDGNYTLHIPAGAYTINGTNNAAIEEAFTVGNASQNGETEVVFNAYDLGSSFVANYTTPIVGEGVTITPGSNVSLNVYECGDIFLAQGSLIFTSKKDAITSIEFEGMDNAVVTKGAFANGVWTVDMANGESATITSTVGSAITKITVNYNGGAKQEGNTNTNGEIVITYPTENSTISHISNGGLLAEFTTTKQYAQVTIELRNKNDMWHNLYDLPMRYMDSVEPGAHSCRTQTPNESNFYLFIGDEYELIVKGFINYWDVMPDNYDAMAVITVQGNGIPHETLSDVKLVSVTPENGGDIYSGNAVVTLEFDGPVSSVKGEHPMGFDGADTFTGTKKSNDGKKWEINLGDISGSASAETETTIYELDITAKDTNGHTVVFNDQRADYALVLMLNVTDNPATGISVMKANDNDNVIYNIAGQRIDTLRKGINIVNGKKILK